MLKLILKASGVSWSSALFSSKSSILLHRQPLPRRRLRTMHLRRRQSPRPRRHHSDSRVQLESAIDGVLRHHARRHRLLLYRNGFIAELVWKQIFFRLLRILQVFKSVFHENIRMRSGILELEFNNIWVDFGKRLCADVAHVQLLAFVRERHFIEVLLLLWALICHFSEGVHAGCSIFFLLLLLFSFFSHHFFVFACFLRSEQVDPHV